MGEWLSRGELRRRSISSSVERSKVEMFEREGAAIIECAVVKRGNMSRHAHRAAVCAGEDVSLRGLTHAKNLISAKRNGSCVVSTPGYTCIAMIRSTGPLASSLCSPQSGRNERFRLYCHKDGREARRHFREYT